MILLSKNLCPYLTSEVINSCKASGIQTILEFLSHDAETLSRKTFVPYKIITSIRCVLLACYSASFQTADIVYEELLSSISILNTGHSSLDDFLDGGIYTNEITEIHGSPGTGKTQLCLNLVSNLIFETGKTAVFIDTNSSFFSHRLKEFLQFRTHNSKKIKNALSKVHVMNVHDVFGLFDAIHYIKEKLRYENEQFSCLRMVVIDSITALIAPCFGDLQSDGMGIMMNVSHQLKVLCSELNLAIVITNNTVHADQLVRKPALGRYWKHVSSVILSINFENENPFEICRQRKILLIKSCRKDIAGEIVMQFFNGNMQITNKTQSS